MALNIEETSQGALKHRQSTLIMVFNGITDAGEMASTRRTWEDAASRMLKAIIQSYAEMGDAYEAQVDGLGEAAFASFRGKLNKLRISLNLPSEMKEVPESSIKEFASAVKKLTSLGSWALNADQISSVRGRFAEHNVKWLKAARLGQFKPVPRKGVTVGMHWMLLEPVENDYWQDAHR